MSEDTPPPKWQPKARLPFDPTMAPGGGQGGRTMLLVVYAVAFLAMAGAAGVMVFQRGYAFTTPQVFVPSLGAVWFLIRLVMVARPNAG